MIRLTQCRVVAATALALLLCQQAAPAQNIILKDGRTIVTKSIRRQGDNIMATVEIPTSSASSAPSRPQLGEIGYPVSSIEKLDFPEPTQLRNVPDLILQGKAAEALRQIEPVVRYYEGFRDAPGSWWDEAALLKVQALLAMGNEKEADPLIELIARFVTRPETVRAAQALKAAAMTRNGSHAEALKIYETLTKEAMRHWTLATVAVNKGRSHLALKQYEPALLSFLQIPVFYPDEKIFVPQAMLGSAQAYFALEDLPRAKETLKELIQEYPSSPQAKDAADEQEKIARREKALEEPK